MAYFENSDYAFNLLDLILQSPSINQNDAHVFASDDQMTKQTSPVQQHDDLQSSVQAPSLFLRNQFSYSKMENPASEVPNWCFNSSSNFVNNNQTHSREPCVDTLSDIAPLNVSTSFRSTETYPAIPPVIMSSSIDS